MWKEAVLSRFILLNMRADYLCHSVITCACSVFFCFCFFFGPLSVFSRWNYMKACKMWSRYLFPRHSSAAVCLLPSATPTRTAFTPVIGTDWLSAGSENDPIRFHRLSVSQMHISSSTTTIVQHMPFFFLNVSWCGNPQKGPPCQILQLFGMIFWTHGKPKSFKDWF